MKDLDSLVDALEAFVDAKIEYVRSRSRSPEWASSADVDRARDELGKRLAAVLECKHVWGVPRDSHRLSSAVPSVCILCGAPHPGAAP